MDKHFVRLVTDETARLRHAQKQQNRDPFSKYNGSSELALASTDGFEPPPVLPVNAIVDRTDHPDLAQ